MAKKILIVEDEPHIADTITYALGTEGFEHVWCSTGADALESLADGSDYNLIVLDVGLPDISGFDICRKIREKSNLPIIFLTARSEEIDRVVGLEIGGDDYISKPFSPRELTARIKAVLRRSSERPSIPGEGGNLIVDEERAQIIYFGTPLQLSRYEFKLLQALTSNPGQVFSRSQLMNIAWTEPELSLERTIDAHIKKIRAKLKTIKDNVEPIITHRGFGYSLNPDL